VRLDDRRAADVVVRLTIVLAANVCSRFARA
jgi:hypothetical protein